MSQDLQQIVNKIQSLFLKGQQKKFNHKNKNNKNSKSNNHSNNNSQNNQNKKRMNKKKMKDGLKSVNHKASKPKQKKENDVSYIINIYEKKIFKK